MKIRATTRAHSRPGRARPWRRATAAGIVLSCSACGNPSAPGTTLEGRWGGPHFGVGVMADRADTWFDCAHGHMETPVRVDDDGRFSVSGEYVVDAGPARPFAARYQGTVEGSRLEVLVLVAADAVAAPDTLGPFTAIRNGAIDVVLCR